MGKNIGNSRIVRRFESNDKKLGENIFEVRRTRGGHRRYLLEENETKKTVIYSRVSSQDQKADPKRQTEELEEYCKENEIEKVEIIEEIGFGMNYRKRGLRKLIKLIEGGEIERIVISFKNRLMRFGNEIIYQFCARTHIKPE